MWLVEARGVPVKFDHRLIAHSVLYNLDLETFFL